MHMYVSSLLLDIKVDGWGDRIIASVEETIIETRCDKSDQADIAVRGQHQMGDMENEIFHSEVCQAVVEAQAEKHVENSVESEISNYLTFFQSNIQFLISCLGIENLITMKKLKHHLAVCRRLGLDDFIADFCRTLLQLFPLTSENAYAFIFLLNNIIWGSQDWIESALEEWLQKITDLDRNSAFPRIYTSDPLLDMLELIIMFHQISRSDQEKTLSWKRVYHAVAVQRYPDLTSQLCLGFGIGVFGLSTSRLRAHSYPIGEDLSDMPWSIGEAQQRDQADLAETQNLVANIKTSYQQYIDKALALPTTERRTFALGQLLLHFKKSVGMIDDDTPEYWILSMGAEEGSSIFERGGAGTRIEDEGRSKGECDTEEEQSFFGEDALHDFVRQSNITVGELATIIRQMPVPDDALPGVHIGLDEESVRESEEDEDDEERLSVDLSGLILHTF